jgi:hypothetical protein
MRAAKSSGPLLPFYFLGDRLNLSGGYRGMLSIGEHSNFTTFDALRTRA